MKENTRIGTICKIAAVVLLIIGLIGSFVIAQPSDFSRAFGSREFNFPLFLGSFIMVGLFCMQLFALGEIVDYLASIHKRETEIIGRLRETPQQDVASVPQVKTTDKPSAPPTAQPAAQSATARTAHGEVTPDGDIICSVCGYKQKADRTICWNCGAKFDS